MVRALINGLSSGGLLAVFALPYALTLWVTRNFAFHGIAFISLGGYLLHEIYRHGVPLGVALPAAMLAGAVLMVALELVLFAPLKRRGANRLSLFIISFGLVAVIENVGFIIWGSTAIPIPDPIRDAGFTVNGVYIAGIQILQFIVGIVAFVSFWLLLRSAIGLQIRAVIDGEEVAATHGIRPVRLSILVTALLGAALVLVGGLQSIDAGAQLGRGNREFLFVFIASFAAGSRLPIVAGVIAGLFGVMASVLPLWMPGAWVPALFVMALAAVLVIKPPGQEFVLPKIFSKRKVIEAV